MPASTAERLHLALLDVCQFSALYCGRDSVGGLRCALAWSSGAASEPRGTYGMFVLSGRIFGWRSRHRVLEQLSFED